MQKPVLLETRGIPSKSRATAASNLLHISTFFGFPLLGVCKVTAAVEIGLSSIDVVIFIDPSLVKAFLRFKSISNW